MARAYSLDLRKRVFAAWQKGEDSQQAVAKRFGVSESFVRDLSALHRQTGEVVARARGGGRQRLASAATLECLHNQVAAHNDHTIAEHQQTLAAAGHPMSKATTGRLLLGLRLTRKKRRSETTRPKANG
jgi:transposase